MHQSWLKLRPSLPKLAEVGPSWPKVGLKLAQRCRQDGPKSVKSVATHNENPPRSRQGFAKEPPRSHQGPHFRIQCPQGCPQIKSRMKEQSTGTARAKEQGTGQGTKDTGQGMMRGSNTPWAQGPANFSYIFCLSKTARVIRDNERWEGVGGR